MTSLALGSKLSSINARTRVAKAVANFLTGLPQKLVRTTRAGLATCIGPDGTMGWGPHNNIPESQNFGAWTKLGTVPIVTPSAGVDADGTPTDRIYFPASGPGNRIQQTTPSIGLGSIRIRLKGEVGGEQIYVWNGWSSINQLVVLTTQYQDFTFSESAVNASSGIYLYAASGTPTIYATRAQHNHGPIQEYLNSTVKNRCPSSNDFTQWTALAGGTGVAPKVYPNASVGPNGQPAALISFNIGGGTTGSDVSYIQASPTSFTGPAMGGLWVKTADGSTKNVTFRVGASTFAYTQTVNANWQQLSLQGASTIDRITLLAYGDKDSQTSNILVCDCQLNPGTTLWPYSYNPGPAPAVGAFYGQRTDYDPITLACKGALIEPTQVTQLLANPDDLSASPWTPLNGTCPATDDGTKFRGRRFWKIAKSGTTAYEQRIQLTQAGITGKHTVDFAAMASANSATVSFALYGESSGQGVNGDSSFTIVSGPGTVTQVVGGSFNIAGLSTNVPTVGYLTRNFTISELASVRIYPDAGSTTAGRYNYFQVGNLVAGTDGGGSFIPNPATSGTVVRVADTSSVGYDDLAKALPWLMDANTLSYPESLDNAEWLRTRATITPDAAIAPDGTMTADKLVGVNGQAGGYFYRSNVPVTSGAPNTQTIFLKAGEVTNVVLHSNMTGSYKDATLNLVTGAVTFNTFVTPPTMTPRPNGWWRMTLTEQASVAAANILYIDIGAEVGDGVKGFYAWGGTCAPGPIAQTYYPQASKQGTIVFEGDLTYGAGSAGVVLASLDTGAATGVEFYKATANNNFFGYVGANNAISGTISSGSPIKSAIGFSPSSAGIALNGGSEVSITASVLPSGIKQLLIGKGYSGNAASSMHIRRLRIFSQNLPASTKQALTR